jgi:hypothetical protein
MSPSGMPNADSDAQSDITEQWVILQDDDSTTIASTTGPAECGTARGWTVPLD